MLHFIRDAVVVNFFNPNKNNGFFHPTGQTHTMTVNKPVTNGFDRYRCNLIDNQIYVKL